MRAAASLVILAVGLLSSGCGVLGGKSPSDQPPIGLADGAPSVDVLMDRLLDALSRQDEDGLRRLRVNKEEYVKIIMPGQVEKGKPPLPRVDSVGDYAWSLLDTKSLYYTESLMKEFGGRRNTRKTVRFTRPARDYAWYRAMGEVRLMVEDPEDHREYELSSGWIAEVDGKYKFIGFEYEDD